jgi:hypothetical protein
MRNVVLPNRTRGRDWHFTVALPRLTLRSPPQIMELRDQGKTWTEVAEHARMTRSGAWSGYRELHWALAVGSRTVGFRIPSAPCADAAFVSRNCRLRFIRKPVVTRNECGAPPRLSIAICACRRGQRARR